MTFVRNTSIFAANTVIRSWAEWQRDIALCHPLTGMEALFARAPRESRPVAKSDDFAICNEMAPGNATKPAAAAGMPLARVRSVPRSEPLIHVWNGSDRLTCDGVAVGLLRDNVEHFSQRHERRDLVQLHSLADVTFGQRPAQLEPSRLCDELCAGWDCVWQVPIGALVMGQGTRALLRAQLGPFPRRNEVATWLGRQSSSGARCATLGELVANLVHELFALAARAQASDVIQCATPQMLAHAPAFSQALPTTLGPSGPFRQ